MAIELPKDVEGREIPLDTVVLFNRHGETYNIVRWTFTTDFDLADGWSNKWRAITDRGFAIDPELVYLITPHDSWEKLEEDLDRVASCGDSDTPVCTYARQPCAVCKFHSSENCTSAMCADIALRIRKLRGED